MSFSDQSLVATNCHHQDSRSLKPHNFFSKAMPLTKAEQNARAYQKRLAKKETTRQRSNQYNKKSRAKKKAEKAMATNNTKNALVEHNGGTGIMTAPPTPRQVRMQPSAAMLAMDPSHRTDILDRLERILQIESTEVLASEQLLHDRSLQAARALRQDQNQAFADMRAEQSQNLAGTIESNHRELAEVRSARKVRFDQTFDVLLAEVEAPPPFSPDPGSIDGPPPATPGPPSTTTAQEPPIETAGPSFGSQVLDFSKAVVSLPYTIPKAAVVGVYSTGARLLRTPTSHAAPGAHVTVASQQSGGESALGRMDRSAAEAQGGESPVIHRRRVIVQHAEDQELKATNTEMNNASLDNASRRSTRKKTPKQPQSVGESGNSVYQVERSTGTELGEEPIIRRRNVVAFHLAEQHGDDDESESESGNVPVQPTPNRRSTRAAKTPQQTPFTKSAQKNNTNPRKTAPPAVEVEPPATATQGVKLTKAELKERAHLEMTIKDPTDNEVQNMTKPTLFEFIASRGWTPPKKNTRVEPLKLHVLRMLAFERDQLEALENEQELVCEGDDDSVEDYSD